ncbi:MAG: hypothetical protein ACX932_03705 [Gammaproteobacteria bacterium]
MDLSAVTEQNNSSKESLSTEKVDKTTELLDIAALDVALYTLANYGLVLFAQWQKAVEGWSADNPDRQRLRHVVEQILVPFWTHHGEALTVGLSQKTVQGLQSLMTQFDDSKMALSRTVSDLSGIQKIFKVTDTDNLPTVLPATASEQDKEVWQQRVEKNELTLLYESAHDEGGHFIVSNKMKDESTKLLVIARWQCIGARLLEVGWTEKGWHWLLSAFLSHGHHRASVAHWQLWLLLLGRAAAQSLEDLQAKTPLKPLPGLRDVVVTDSERHPLLGLSTLSDTAIYRQRLADYRQTLRTCFMAESTFLKEEIEFSVLRERFSIHREALIQWQDNLYLLVAEMFEQARLLLGEPSVPYCFMLTGSLSRNSAVAYSDVEMALLVADPVLVSVMQGIVSQDTDALAKGSDEHRREASHLLHLLRLVRFHLASLGEEGVVLDESGDPLRETYLIGTVESFLNDVQAKCNEEEGWPYSLLHVQTSRSYSNKAGKELLNHYKTCIDKLFATPIAQNGLWRSTQWLLTHQTNNAKKAHRSVDDVVNIKIHALKPLTFLIIDIAGLAGVSMHSVPAALTELIKTGYLPQAMGAALLSTWERLLQWRCHRQLIHQGPIDTLYAPCLLSDLRKEDEAQSWKLYLEKKNDKQLRYQVRLPYEEEAVKGELSITTDNKPLAEFLIHEKNQANLLREISKVGQIAEKQVFPPYHQAELVASIEIILSYFYGLVPQLQKEMRVEEQGHSVPLSERQCLLREYLGAWSLTVALRYCVNSKVADAFAPVSVVFVWTPQDAAIYKTFQATGQEQWGENWNVATARGLYKLLICEDYYLREALLTALIKDLPLETEQSALASPAMQTYLMEELYPVLFTYWIGLKTVVPGLTNCVMTLMDRLMKRRVLKQPQLIAKLEQPTEAGVDDEAKISLTILLNRLWEREKTYIEQYDSLCRRRFITWILGYGVCDTQPSREGYYPWVLQSMAEGNYPLTVLSLLQAGAGKRIAHYQGFSQAYDYLTCQRTQKRPAASEQAWKDAKTDLESSNDGFRWFVFVRDILEQPMERGDLPLASHDGSPEAQPYFYTLPAAIVNQLFTSEGMPQDKSHHGRRQVGEMLYKGHHVHGKFFPELPGVEEAVQVLSQQLQLGSVAWSQLFRCPYRITEQQRDPQKKVHLLSTDTLGFPLLLSQHVGGENVQDGLSDYPAAMEKRLSQLHRGHFTRLLLLTLLVHPEDGQPANFILSTTEPDKEGRIYKLTSVDNDHAFVVPWVKTDKNEVQMQIKTLVYCLDAMSQPLDVEVLQEFIAHIVFLTATENVQENHSDKIINSEQVTAVLRQWLETLDKRYEAYYQLFSDKERKGLQAPHKKPYRLPLSRDQQQSDAITPLLQLTPQDVGGVYERLERLLEVLNTTEDLSSLIGLNLLQRVSPLVYPCYEVLHQRYDTVQARFQHIGAKQYEETLETDPQTGKTRVRYSSCRTSTLLLQQRGIPDKALVTGMAFRPSELLQRLSDFSVIHYQQIGRQLTSIQHNTMKKGEKAYYGLLLDRQRGAVLRSIKNPSVSQQQRLLGYWNGLVVDILPLLKFNLLDNALLKRVLQNKPLLHTLHITDSESLTEKGVEHIGRYAPVLHTLVMKRCRGLSQWPQWYMTTGLLFGDEKHCIFPQLQTLHIEGCPITRLPLWTPQLTTLHLAHCINLETVWIYSLGPSFSTLILKALSKLSVESFRYLSQYLHYTNGKKRLTVEELSSMKTPTRTRALLKALWSVDPDAHHIAAGESLVDLLVSPVDEESGHSRFSNRCQESQLPLLKLDLRGLPLSNAWVSLLIERCRKKDIQQWQWPTLPVGSEGQLLALGSCRDVEKMTVQSVICWGGDKPSTVMESYGYFNIVTVLQVLPDGSVMSGSRDTTLSHWVHEGEEEWACGSVLKGHAGEVTALEILPDGSVMSGSNDKTLRHWRCGDDGQWACASVLKGHTNPVKVLQVLPDGSVISGPGESIILTAKILSSPKDRALRHWVCGGDGKWVCGSVLEGHTASVTVLEVLPDGSVVSGSADSTLRHWVCVGGRKWICRSILEGHANSVKVLQVLPDGSVMSGSSDKTLHHWVPDGQGKWTCVSILKGHVGEVTTLEILLDGSVMSGSADKTLRHWARGDDGKWTCGMVLEGHADEVTALKVLPDGSVVSGSWDSTLRHWMYRGARKWVCGSVLKGHTKQVCFLQALPDGSVVSGSNDKTLRHWSRLLVTLPLKALSTVVQAISHPLPIKIEWQEDKMIVDALETLEKTFQKSVERQKGMGVEPGDGMEEQKATISSLAVALRAVLKALMMVNDTGESATKDHSIAMLFTMEESSSFPIVIKSEQKKVLLGLMEGLLRGLTPGAVSIAGSLGIDESQLMLLLERTQRFRCVSIDHFLSFLCRQRIIQSQSYLTTLQWANRSILLPIPVLQPDLVFQVLPDGSVVSNSGDGGLHHWMREDGGDWICASVLEPSVYSSWFFLGTIKALQLLPDRKLVSVDGDGTSLTYWMRGDDGSWKRTLMLPVPYTDNYGTVCNSWRTKIVQVLSDGSIICGHDDTILHHWVPVHYREWEHVSVLEGHTRPVKALQVLLDGSLMSGSEDKTLRHWVRRDDENWTCGPVLEGHTASVTALEVLPDGSVISGSEDKTLRHWVRRGDGSWACESVINTHPHSAQALRALPDGSLLSSFLGPLRYWVRRWSGEWVCASELECYTDSLEDLYGLPAGRVPNNLRTNTSYQQPIATRYQLSLPTASDLRRLWLTAISSKRKSAGQSMPYMPLPKCLWTCHISSSQEIGMTVHHTAYPEWLTAIKAIGIKIFKGMAGLRAHTVTETQDTVICTFQESLASNYLKEIQGTLQALHKRIEGDWLPNPSLVKAKAVSAKKKTTKDNMPRRFHHDSPLSSHRKFSTQSNKPFSMTTKVQAYLNKGDEFMQNNAIKEALEQYEAGLAYLQLLVPHGRNIEETKLYNTFTGRITGAKDLLVQTQEERTVVDVSDGSSAISSARASSQRRP